LKGSFQRCRISVCNPKTREPLFAISPRTRRKRDDLSIRGTIRGDNSVSVRHYCFPWGDNSVSWGDNSVSVRHYWGQFGVSSSLLLPLHQVGGTIRCQFVIIASLASSR